MLYLHFFLTDNIHDSQADENKDEGYPPTIAGMLRFCIDDEPDDPCNECYEPNPEKKADEKIQNYDKNYDDADDVVVAPSECHLQPCSQAD